MDPTAPPRREPHVPPAFGADRVTPGRDGSFLLDCAVSKGWTGRRTRTLTSAEYPGTAVRWEEQLFEVLEAIPSGTGGTRYRLAPWDSEHVIRGAEIYDAASEQGRQSEQTQRAADLWKRRLAILLAPLAGHLPASVQQRMEGDFGAPARAMTIASALPLFTLGALGLLAARIAELGADTPFLSWLAARPLLCLYLAAESGIRLWAVLVTAEPIGSIPGLLAYEVWRAVARKRRARSAAPLAGWEPGDLFHMLEPLLALLSREEQDLLARRFGFQALRWGKRTAVVVGILAGSNVVISWGVLLENRGSFWGFFWLAAGGYLLTEQAVRWRSLARKRPAGSALGGLVRPLASRLLRN